MTVSEVVAFLVNISIRIFELLIIAVESLEGDSETISAILDENEEWLNKQMREIETQMMIDKLYE